MRMRQPPKQFHLALKTPDSPRAEALPQKLHGHESLRFLLAAPIDVAHAAGGKPCFDDHVANGGADERIVIVKTVLGGGDADRWQPGRIDSPGCRLVACGER